VRRGLFISERLSEAGHFIWVYDDGQVPRGRDASLVITPAIIHGRTGGGGCGDLGPGHLQGVPRLTVPA
jgi:hypothetical protein